MSDEERDRLQQQFQTLADRMRLRGDTGQARTIEEEHGRDSRGPAPAA
jgi:hypothetical protein